MFSLPLTITGEFLNPLPGLTSLWAQGTTGPRAQGPKSPRAHGPFRPWAQGPKGPWAQGPKSPWAQVPKLASQGPKCVKGPSLQAMGACAQVAERPKPPSREPKGPSLQAMGPCLQARYTSAHEPAPGSKLASKAGHKQTGPGPNGPWAKWDQTCQVAQPDPRHRPTKAAGQLDVIAVCITLANS